MVIKTCTLEMTKLINNLYFNNQILRKLNSKEKMYGLFNKQN